MVFICTTQAKSYSRMANTCEKSLKFSWHKSLYQTEPLRPGLAGEMQLDDGQGNPEN